MLAFAKYQLHHVNKMPSVFPPLVGSHRKLKLDHSPRESPFKNGTPTHRQKHDEEENFLRRMKKARDVILSHQRSKKLLTQNGNRIIIERSKTDNSERIYRRPQQKCFSQVVYNCVGSVPKRVHKKDSSDLQNFNDKILRECKSEFMPNQKQKYKPSKYYLNIPKKHNKTQQSELRRPKAMFTDQNHGLKSQKGIKKLKAENMQKKMMNILFPEDVIASNGQELILKLKKCREEKENPQLASPDQNNQKQNKEEAEESVTHRTEEQQMQFPYFQSKRKKQKVKSKFLSRMKQSHKEKLQTSFQNDRQMDEQLQSKIEQKMKEGSSMEIQGNQKQRRKERQVLKNQSKSAYFDDNFKLQAWNSKKESQFQLF